MRFIQSRQRSADIRDMKKSDNILLTAIFVRIVRIIWARAVASADKIPGIAMKPKERKERAEEFFPWHVRTLLKFSRIRPISGRGAGDLGCLPSTADYDSRRLRCWRGELECALASRPDLIWIIHGFVTDVHVFYAVREKKEVRVAGRIHDALSKNATVRVALRKLYTNHVAFGITTIRVFQQARLYVKEFANQV